MTHHRKIFWIRLPDLIHTPFQYNTLCVSDENLEKEITYQPVALFVW
jgi:hypothetical protein